MTADPIDLSSEIGDICRILGLEPKYVARLELMPHRAVATLYTGKEGRFKGDKHVDPDTGEPVQETLEYEITS